MMPLTIAIVLTLTMSGCSADNSSVKETETPAQVESSTQITAQCTDSDLGKDTSLKGKVSLGNQSFLDKCVSNFVIEYYCEDGQALSQNFRCENNCDNGACV